MTKEEARDFCSNNITVVITNRGKAEKVMIVGVSNTSEEALVAFPFRFDEEEIRIEWVSLKNLS